MAELGSLGVTVRAAIAKAGGDAGAWIDAYAAKNGWFRLDQAQRRLEAWIANLDDEPDERPLGVVRAVYEDACRVMADGFTRALVAAKWTVSACLHQTKIFSDIVSEQPKPVAYFFVDAMRFEMGVELSERLPKSAEVSVRPAVCALPSITPIGMAALQPGARSVLALSNRPAFSAQKSTARSFQTRPRGENSRLRACQGLPTYALDELLSLQPFPAFQKKDRGRSGHHRAVPGDRPRRRAWVPRSRLGR